MPASHLSQHTVGLVALALSACDVLPTAEPIPLDPGSLTAMVDSTSFEGTPTQITRTSGLVYLNVESADGSEIGLTFPDSAGTYAFRPDGTGTPGFFLVYQDGATGRASVAALGPGADVIVTAISDADVQGTFSGVLNDELFTGPRVVSAGRFDVAFDDAPGG